MIVIIGTQWVCSLHFKFWIAAAQEDPIVASHLADAETYSDFLSLYLQDSPEARNHGLWTAGMFSFPDE